MPGYESPQASEFRSIVPLETATPSAENNATNEDTGAKLPHAIHRAETGIVPSYIGEGKSTHLQAPEPTQIITGKRNSDGNNELRIDTVAREPPRSDGAMGLVYIKKSNSPANRLPTSITASGNCAATAQRNGPARSSRGTGSPVGPGTTATSSAVPAAGRIRIACSMSAT